jgi:hypothetical protein
MVLTVVSHILLAVVILPPHFFSLIMRHRHFQSNIEYTILYLSLCSPYSNAFVQNHNSMFKEQSRRFGTNIFQAGQLDITCCTTLTLPPNAAEVAHQ